MKKALILVDLQNDFLPGGALAVAQGDQTIPVANALLKKKNALFDMVIATQDFHPKIHGSFASNNPGKNVFEMGDLAGLPQVMWPDHCVQGSSGAEFATQLDVTGIDKVFQKGLDPAIDSYSGFYDNGHRKSTGLGDYLKAQGVGEVIVMGLATDYCVKFTALDAITLGFQTTLITDGSRGVNMSPDDSANAIAEMRAAGASTMTSEEYLRKAL
jgi:nicotinamidase/pyrazinamidase